MRNRNVDASSLNRRTEYIAAPPDRVNEGFLVPLQFRAKPVDVHLDDVGRAFPVGFPQTAEHRARDDLAGVRISISRMLNRSRQVDVNAARRDARVSPDRGVSGPTSMLMVGLMVERRLAASTRAKSSVIANGLTR